MNTVVFIIIIIILPVYSLIVTELGKMELNTHLYLSLSYEKQKIFLFYFVEFNAEIPKIM